jgi:hypothetical protein
MHAPRGESNDDVDAQAAAVRCERGLGRTDAADRLMTAITESSRRDRVTRELQPAITGLRVQFLVSRSE